VQLYPVSICARKGSVHISHSAALIEAENADECRGKALRLAYKIYPLENDWRDYSFNLAQPGYIVRDPENASLLPGQPQ
jgi:hypothetical protein